MSKDDEKPSVVGGFASFINGLTWLGQPPRRPRDRWDDKYEPARWEVPVAVTVTVALVLVGVIAVGLALSWGAAWLGSLAGLITAAMVLQPLTALLRRRLN